MRWVYVLRSSSSGNIYVGETTKLFTRWTQHANGKCKTTQSDCYDKVIGIYNVSGNISFIENRDRMINGYDAWKVRDYWDKCEDKQDALYVEKHIVERYMLDRGINKYDIKGWFYLNDERCGNFCFGEDVKNYKRDRPLCDCGFPCEINKTKDSKKLYFSCPIPSWIRGDEIPQRCDFYQEFTQYRNILESYNPRLALAVDIFEDEE